MTNWLKYHALSFYIELTSDDLDALLQFVRRRVVIDPKYSRNGDGCTPEDDGGTMIDT